MATDYWSSTSTPGNRKLKSRQANAFNDINKHYFWIKDPREENISYLKNSLFWWRHLHDWSSSSKIFRKQKWLLKVKILPYPKKSRNSAIVLMLQEKRNFSPSEFTKSFSWGSKRSTYFTLITWSYFKTLNLVRIELTKCFVM